jgi:hypothetical protein
VSSALLRYFVSQFSAEPPVPDRNGLLPPAIQLPRANVLVMRQAPGRVSTNAELKQLSVNYDRDVLFVRPGRGIAEPIILDAVFGMPRGPLLLTGMTACRLSNDLLWLVPPEVAVRVAISKCGMRLVPRHSWWSAVDTRAGQALANKELAQAYRAQVGC